MEEKIKAMLAEHLCVPLDKVIREARLIEDLGADSLDAIDIYMFLEQDFGVKIVDGRMVELITVGDVVSCATKAQT